MSRSKWIKKKQRIFFFFFFFFNYYYFIFFILTRIDTYAERIDTSYRRLLDRCIDSKSIFFTPLVDRVSDSRWTGILEQDAEHRHAH